MNHFDELDDLIRTLWPVIYFLGALFLAVICRGIVGAIFSG